MKDNQQIG